MTCCDDRLNPGYLHAEAMVVSPFESVFML